MILISSYFNITDIAVEYLVITIDECIRLLTHGWISILLHEDASHEIKYLGAITKSRVFTT